MQTSLLTTIPSTIAPTLFTIGFTQKSAQQFFNLLSDNGIRRLVDTRIFPDTQLSGFAKKRDLPYFCRELAGATYSHLPELAPTADLLRDYKDKKIDWNQYEIAYLTLLERRRVQDLLSYQELLDYPTAFLCAEPTDKYCHRRLLVQYLIGHWPSLLRKDLH